MIGRQSELRSVHAFLDDLGTGPVALTLDGDAGVGKTTVWDAAVAEALKRGLAVLTARPVEPEARLPYAALADILGGALDATSDLPSIQRLALSIAVFRTGPEDASTDPGTVAAAALGTLRELARSGPVMIAVDDELWLDAETVSVLVFCLRRIGELPVGLISTSRPIELPQARSRLAHALAPERSRTLRLEPLGIDEIDTLIRERVGLRLSTPRLRRVVEASGGNPFWALELAHVLEGVDDLSRPGDVFPVPVELRELVRARVSDLPSETRRLLLVAAASARPTVSLLEAVTEQRGSVIEALDEAVRAGMIQVRGDEIRYVHPLFASAVFLDAPQRARLDVHRRLADIAPTLEERARHLALSTEGPDAGVSAALEEAARHASERGAPAIGAELCDLALDLTPPEHEDDLTRLRMTAADLHHTAGDSAKAAEVLERVLADSAAGEQRAEALVKLGRVTFGSDVSSAAGYFSEALLETGAGADVRAHAHLESAMVWLNDIETVDLVEADRHIEAARDLAQSLDDPGLMAEVLGFHAVIGAFLGRGFDYAMVEEETRLASNVPDFPLEIDPRADRALLLFLEDRFDEARPLYEELLAAVRERGNEPETRWRMGDLARLELRAGRFEAVLRYGAGRGGGAQVALARAHMGDLDEALSEAHEALAEARAEGGIQPIEDSMEAIGTILLMRGDAAGADEWLRPAWQVFLRAGAAEPNKTLFVPTEIEALVQMAELERAEEMVAWLEERGRTLDRPRALATAARCRGLFLAKKGDLVGAVTSLDEAIHHHERLPVPFERARTLLAAGTVRRRAKQKRPAREALEEAVRIFDALGARYWADRARTELAAVGGRPPASDELSGSETRVARLASEGKTNREIADVLFLSPRTVEDHLSNAYRKLGVRSRTELAKTLHDREATTRV